MFWLVLKTVPENVLERLTLISTVCYTILLLNDDSE